MLVKKLFLLVPLLLLIGSGYFLYLKSPKKVEPTPSSPQPIQVQTEGRTKVKYPQDFTVVLLGDSMTERLGNSDELRAYLKKSYPDKTFEFLNYGFGSTNILTVQERLEKDTFYGRTFRPILDIDFDLILFESFGHNPLSELPLEEGLRRQEEALDKAVEAIKKENPDAKIVFVATISPNKRKYAEGVVRLTLEQKEIWTSERVAYIKNHIKYAEDHQIPLVNVFEKSLDEGGDGKLIYIDDHDYIHPSPSGIIFISQEIAKFIKENSLLTP